MKKTLIITFLFLFSLSSWGCKSVKCVIGAGSKVEENESFNHYDFTSFKGEYSFAKKIDSSTKVRIVTFSEDDIDLIIKISKDEEVVYEYVLNKNNNGTNYIFLEEGKYEVTLNSEELIKAEILFNWKESGQDE